MKKLNPSLIGLFQALGVIIYCGLIVGFFQLMGDTGTAPPIFFTSLAMLALLVFSVAVVGLIIFGYPAVLALNKKIKEALSIVGFTLLYCFGIIMIIIILIIVLA